MDKKSCAIEGCERPMKARGWCITHYRRWNRTGDPEVMRSSRLDYLSPPDRIKAMSCVDPETECWIWIRKVERNGYGRIRISGVSIGAHRFSYEAFVGLIGDGLTVDHLCRNRACVNPSHLEVVTQQTNILRGTSIPAMNASKTHCPRGHSYDLINTKFAGGKRSCRKCQADRERVGR